MTVDPSQRIINPANINNVKKETSKLILQMQNNPLGNSGTFQDAKVFRNQMDHTFSNAIPAGNHLKESILSGLEIQQQCLENMKQGKPLSIDLNHFNGTLPKHLHLSYFGSNTHSVDLVITKNESGMFLTICNRGYRGRFDDQHNIFETYKVTQNINELINDLHKIEKENGTIEDFYHRCGTSIPNHELEKNGFKQPPKTKNQKAGNCVRTSMSAAQKWLANQHDCPEAHKAVKPTILSNTEDTIRQKTVALRQIILPESPPQLNKPVLILVKETLDEIEAPLIPNSETETFIKVIPELINDLCFIVDDNNFIKDNEPLLIQIVNKLETFHSLREFFDQILEEIRNQFKH